MELIAAGVGVLVGLALGVMGARLRGAARLARLEASLAGSEARLAANHEGEARLEQSMRALTFEATAQSHEAVSRAVAPLHEALRRYEQQVAELERDRVDAYAQLRTQLGQVHSDSAALREETGRLVGALRAPTVRGRWGEQQLRRIVEAAGMLDRCDFAEQVSAAAGGENKRPDLVVTLHGGRSIVVDAKAPLEAYLSAMEAPDDKTRAALLDRHAQALRTHIGTLAAKRYWTAFDLAPDFVVLFLPADPFLDAGLARDATLLEYALENNVALATPATLMALLRTVAFSWRQEAFTHNAVEVYELGRKLYERLATVSEHLGRVGTSLGATVTAYNTVVGSLESRVLVSARRFAELGLTADEITSPPQVEIAPRRPVGTPALEPSP
jgi:DNA recombination protein RmuC